MRWFIHVMLRLFFTRPTTFIPRSHTESQSKVFASMGPARDELLASATAHAATLSAGDAVIFDSRLLHAGTANLPKEQGGGHHVNPSDSWQ
jgi:ectoine hydroxylase-related dioxygenase (phytanoyl-CoA dioxygenase family)